MASATPPTNKPYHHGHLRDALVGAGLELARHGGADAVTLRAVTRAAGVSPAAAYRHFVDVDELLSAIGARALRSLAEAIEDEQAKATRAFEDDGTGGGAAARAAELALAHLRAVGQGYIRFALDRTKVFELAMFGLPTMADAHRPDAAGRTGRTPYELLADAVAGLVAAGVLPAERTDAVMVLCWSTVHGFAALATQGPLRELPRETLEAAGTAVIEGVTAALRPVPGS